MALKSLKHFWLILLNHLRNRFYALPHHQEIKKKVLLYAARNVLLNIAVKDLFKTTPNVVWPSFAFGIYGPSKN